MHYITDYQLDINKGFICKVNGKPFRCEFLTTEVLGKHFYVSNILKVADAMGVPRYEFIGIFNSEHVNHVIYCDSRQQCYDLCQHIVKTYFKPTKDWRDIINFRCGNESYKFELTVLAGKFMWRNSYDDSTPLINKSQVDVQKVKEELSINIYTLAHCDSFGFDSREDALKFAKWAKEHFYDKQEYEFKQSLVKYYIDYDCIVNNTNKEICEKSREQLKHYYHGTEQVNFPNGTFILKQVRVGEYSWRGANPNIGPKDLYKQFELSTEQVLKICNNLKLQAYFWSDILYFDNKENAVKFTDYLIETYIIKKEKTYDTNQLRKERTAISRGAKPAGSIIHGRRSKASVRCGRIEHKARLGS